MTLPFSAVGFRILFASLLFTKRSWVCTINLFAFFAMIYVSPASHSRSHWKAKEKPHLFLAKAVVYHLELFMTPKTKYGWKPSLFRFLTVLMPTYSMLLFSKCALFLTVLFGSFIFRAKMLITVEKEIQKSACLLPRQSYGNLLDSWQLQNGPVLNILDFFPPYLFFQRVKWM